MPGSDPHWRSDAIVAAVRACVGTRFRSQGRRPGVALDCVGVALVAAQAAGLSAFDVPHYQLGGDHEMVLDSMLTRLGLAKTVSACRGDLWLFAPQAGRRHLAVQVGPGWPSAELPVQFVHAHAGVGRVVEAPADPGWDLLGTFRFPERQ